jgi:hypothetical protein
VGGGEFVKLRCELRTLDALARGLTRFAAAPGAPDWLISGVWLETAERPYLATSTVEVLADGFVARSLCITTADEFTQHLEGEIPDIEARLRSRGNDLVLSEAVPLEPPQSLEPWPPEQYSMAILVRASQCQRGINRVSCGLLFESHAGARLLVGTDAATLAMVLSRDDELIGRYSAGCDELSLEDYSRFASS